MKQGLRHGHLTRYGDMYVKVSNLEIKMLGITNHNLMFS